MPSRGAEHGARRRFPRRSGRTPAGAAAETAPVHEDRHIETPHAREVEPLKMDEKHDHLAAREKCAEDRQEALLDEALEETFPGSDPISPKHIT